MVWLGRLVEAVRTAFAPAAPVPEPLPEKGPEPGLVLLMYYEGCAKKLPNGTYAPYLDQKGVATIGWGNTFYEDGTRVTMRDNPITRARADALLKIIFENFRRRVAAVMPQLSSPRDVGVMTCFAYNIGFEAFRTSTALRLYKLGDLPRTAAAMDWFNLVEGEPNLGLKRRRRAEGLTLQGMEPHKATLQALLDYPK